MEERAIAPDNQGRDDATWRFITFGWLRESPLVDETSIGEERLSYGIIGRYEYICTYGTTRVVKTTIESMRRFLGCNRSVLTALKPGERKEVTIRHRHYVLERRML